MVLRLPVTTSSSCWQTGSRLKPTERRSRLCFQLSPSLLTCTAPPPLGLVAVADLFECACERKARTQMPTRRTRRGHRTRIIGTEACWLEPIEFSRIWSAAIHRRFSLIRSHAHRSRNPRVGMPPSNAPSSVGASFNPEPAATPATVRAALIAAFRSREFARHSQLSRGNAAHGATAASLRAAVPASAHLLYLLHGLRATRKPR
jgi:hypothetical protein